MYTQLSYHAAEVHHQDLLRAAETARLADGLPRRSRFVRLTRIVAAARFSGRPATVGSAAVKVSPGV